MAESDKRLQIIRDGELTPSVLEKPLVASVSGPWQGFRLESFRVFDGASDQPDHVSWPAMQVMLFTAGRYALSRRTGLRAHSYQILPRDLFVHPGGFEVTHIRASGRFEGVIVQVDGPLVSQVIPEHDTLDTDAIVPQHNIPEERVAALIRAMLEEVQTGCPAGALYAESLSLALASYIASRFAVNAADTRSYGGRLSTRQLERVIEFIDANLGNELRLTELASVARLSPRHFARLFKNALGVTPHQYVVRERVHQAKRLLTQGRMNVGDIALSLGFGNQSHFTKIFCEATGITPKRYRREC